MKASLALALLLGTAAHLVHGKAKPDPEENMDAMQLIAYFNYPAEEHTVKTDDGYLLKVHRIPHGREEPAPNAPPRPVLFLQHGMEASSECWMLNFPKQSAAFIFADAGFDVWMGNFRGNIYGLGHDPEIPAKQFWDFGIDPMVDHDLPAMVNYTLTTTGQSSLYMVGHSQGTYVPFAAFSSRPDYWQQRVKAFFALAPVAYNWHMAGMLKTLAKFAKIEQTMFKLFGMNKFSVPAWLMKDLGNTFCSSKKQEEGLCTNLVFMMFGASAHNLNATRIPVYAAHFPQGASTKNLIQFCQGVNSKAFQRFDYGRKNPEHYNGSPTPPQYDATKIKVDTYLYWGKNDTLADPTDVEDILKPLLQRAGALKGNYGVPMNHMDFVAGITAADQIYRPIADIIRHKYLQQGPAGQPDTKH